MTRGWPKGVPRGRKVVVPPLKAEQIILAVLHPRGVAHNLAIAKVRRRVAAAIAVEVEQPDRPYSQDSYLAIAIIQAIGGGRLRQVEQSVHVAGGVLKETKTKTGTKT